MLQTPRRNEIYAHTCCYVPLKIISCFRAESAFLKSLSGATCCNVICMTDIYKMKRSLTHTCSITYIIIYAYNCITISNSCWDNAAFFSMSLAVHLFAQSVCVCDACQIKALLNKYCMRELCFWPSDSCLVTSPSNGAHLIWNRSLHERLLFVKLSAATQKHNQKPCANGALLMKIN
jgi:hypothetical protein